MGVKNHIPAILEFFTSISRSFKTAGSRSWNSLPPLSSILTYLLDSSGLKTYLFAKSASLLYLFVCFFCNVQWVTAATPPLPTSSPSPVETPEKGNQLHKTKNSKKQMRYMRSYQLWDVEALIGSIVIHSYIDGRDPAHTTLNTHSVERDLGRHSWETARVRLCFEHSHTFTRRTKIYQAPTSHSLGSAENVGPENVGPMMSGLRD